MIPSVMGAVVRHRKKSLLLSGGSGLTVDAGFSGLTPSAFTVDGDGLDVVDLAVHAANAANSPLAGMVTTIASSVVRADVAQCIIVVAETGDVDTEIPVDLYILDAAGAPIADVAAADVGITVSGSGNTITAFAGRTNQQGKISTVFESSQAAVKTITPTIDGVAFSNVGTCDLGGDAVALLFFNDNRAATGTGTTAITDDGKMALVNYDVPDDVGDFEVLVNPGTLGFPVEMANIVLIKYSGAVGLSIGRGGAGFQNYLAGVAALAVGASRNFRCYFRNVLPDGAAVAGNDHGQQTNIGDIQLALLIGDAGSGVGRFAVTSSGTPPFPNGSNTGYGLNIAKQKCWRAEWQITRLTTTTFAVAVKLFDEAVSKTAEIYDTADFTRVGFPLQTLADAVLTLSDIDNLTRCFLFGRSGQVGSSYVGDFLYENGFAVSDEGWIGAYPVPGSGEAA